MRVFIRVVACLAVVLFVVGLIQQRARDFALSGSSGAGQPVRQVTVPVEPAVPVEPRSGRAGLQNATGVPRSGRAGLQDADTKAPDPYRSPMVRALGGVIEQHSEVFSGADGELQESLSRADAILTDSRTSNRAALRQANRQVRLPGRSPHLLIVVVDGLRRSDLKCYGPADEATPACDRLANDGIRSTSFTLNTTGADANLFSLLSGALLPAPPASEPPGARLRFADILWQSGYSPGLLGNRAGTGWRAEQPGSWELCFGWTDTPGSTSSDWSPFPAQVSSGGKTLRVSNRDKSASTPFGQILHDEAVSFVRSQKARRPVALVVSTPLAWWQALSEQDATSADTSESVVVDSGRSAAVKRFDEFLGRLVDGLDTEVGKDRLIVMVVGISAETPAVEREALNDSSARGTAPLFVRWSGHVPANGVVDAEIGPTDVLPTVADMIQSTRKPKASAGHSHWNAWRAGGGSRTLAGEL